VAIFDLHTQVNDRLLRRLQRGDPISRDELEMLSNELQGAYDQIKDKEEFKADQIALSLLLALLNQQIQAIANMKQIAEAFRR
jgi:uncharacterized protein (DUF1778 family)